MTYDPFEAFLPRIMREPICGSAKAANQNKMRYALRICRGEKDAHATAFGEPNQSSALRANRIHDRTHVVHPYFQRRCAGHAIGQSLPSFVERHHASKARQTPQKVGETS